MKPMKRTLTLLTAILLAAALMTGCTKLTEAKDNTPSATDAPAETGDGVYVKLERDDVASLYIHGGSFSKVCKNADGSPLKAGEWIYTGEDIVEISKKDNCSVVFTVGATAADDTLLAEGTFLYDAVQEKLYVTISADGVTCSTSDAADAPADVLPVLTLPVLDEIDKRDGGRLRLLSVGGAGGGQPAELGHGHRPWRGRDRRRHLHVAGL